MYLISLKRIIKKYSKLANIFLYPLYFLSGSVKRDPKIWLFGSYHDSFTDNSKYLFLAASENVKNIKTIWITGDRELLRFLKERNLNCCLRWSIKGIYYSLKAKYYFFSAYVKDINFWTSKGAVLANLWHGIPLKKIEYDVEKGKVHDRYGKCNLIYRIFFPHFFSKPSFMLSTSEYVSRIFSGAFRIGVDKLLDIGFPRNDIFFKKKEEILSFVKKYGDKRTEKIIKDIDGKKYCKVFVYLPTFRDTKRNFLSRSIPDVKILNSILAKNDFLMIIKLHQNSELCAELVSQSHIEVLDPKTDIYPILPFSDVLITDYSSIYFDYLMLDKEIIFYPLDYEDYVSKDREMYFDYFDCTPGAKACSYRELLDLITNVVMLDYSKRRQEILKNFFRNIDGLSAKRIINHFLSVA